MKFGQLLEYKMKNIFVEKSYTKWGGETIPRHFYKKLKLSRSLDQWSKVLYSFFIIYQVEDYRNILKLSSRSFAFTSYKAFSKTEKRSLIHEI